MHLFPFLLTRARAPFLAPLPRVLFIHVCKLTRAVFSLSFTCEACCRPLPLQRVLFIHAREPMWVPEVRWSASLADLELVAARGARLRYVSLLCRLVGLRKILASWVGCWQIWGLVDLEARWEAETLRFWPLECVRPSTPLLAICPVLQPAGAAAAAAAHRAQRGHAAPLAGRCAAHAAPQLLLNLRGM